MMRKLILALLLFLPTPALANVPCTLPFNIQNGQPADATQVMANYQAIVNCLGNAAAAGTNADITALTALAAPIPPAGGGTPVFTGGTSTGGANAQIVTTVPIFSPTIGYIVTFTAGFTNTAAMTLQVGSSAAFPVFRRTSTGISSTVGGEVVLNQRHAVTYDANCGPCYQLLSTTPALIGEIRDFAGSTAPPGWLFADGSCQSRTGQFADLFAVIGTTYNTSNPASPCNINQFQLPDARGRVLAGRDTMGQGAAGRLTAPCNGTVLGGDGCGAQSIAIGVANLPVTSFSGATSGALSVSVSGATALASTSGYNLDHTHLYSNLTVGGGYQSGGGLGAAQAYSGALGQTTSLASTAGYNLDHAHTFSGTGATGGALSVSVSSGGSGTALSTLQPLQVVTKIIKF